MIGQTISLYRNLKKSTQITNALLCMILASPILAEDPKMTKEELVSRHIESIGSKEVLAGVRFRNAEGVCLGRGRIFAQAGEESGSLAGEAEFVTGPDTTQFILLLESEHYPVEGFLFDGKDIRLATFKPPHYSGLSETEYSLGQFTNYVSRWEEFIKQGLFGGVLNALWPLLAQEKNSSKMKSLKRRKIDGREFLVLRYHVGGSQGAELFFDPETFHHVATRFRWVAGPSRSGGLADSRVWLTLREEFSNFSVFDGIELPTRWNITLELPRDTSHWEITFDRVRHTEGPELIRSAR